MHAHMKEHLEEEEVVGLPLMRDNFTWKEYTKVTEEILKDGKWYELPQHLQVRSFEGLTLQLLLD